MREFVQYDYYPDECVCSLACSQLISSTQNISTMCWCGDATKVYNYFALIYKGLLNACCQMNDRPNEWTDALKYQSRVSHARPNGWRVLLNYA